MKLSAGFTKLTSSVLMWLFYGACFYFLTLTLKKVDVSLAYAIWSAVGTAMIAAVGILYFREPLTILKVVDMIAIIGRGSGDEHLRWYSWSEPPLARRFGPLPASFTQP